MKTLLNLLPEEKKKAIERRLHFRFLLWQLFLMFLLEGFYLSILFGIYFVLDFQLRSYQATGAETAAASVQERKLNEYQQKFRDANEAVDMASRIERSHLYFTKTFLLLGDLLPNGIAVSRMTTKEYVVMLAGKADKRDDLLLLDDRLKNSACIENVNIPISNLFSQENVDFQIDFSIKPECLHQNSL